MTSLKELADKINAHTAAAKDGTTASIYVAASGYISLGFDPKEAVTEERLAKAILENFARHLEVAGVDAIADLDCPTLTDEA